ncbi:SdpI family protein [Gleimia sp. 6138-11-ORH1]|uniref:SdpI family protein n=1 Tax=Gleimia sp. 6138-11-ORH1 TaxID=2973937 RepID=UPI002169780A|nr:SdpI family protein [Gleimia sp. 6138-11-ORH1]MCS4485139.1 SdpI family protein [Gleimia sp. 6138-11-ORH1]
MEYQLIAWVFSVILLLKGVVIGYISYQAGNIELKRNSLLGVRTKLSQQSLKNWNVANFAGRYLMAVQAGLFLLGAAVLGAYALMYQVTLLGLLVCTVPLIVSVLFFYLANRFVGDKAIKEYNDIAS